MGSLRTHECAQCGHSWICVNCGLDAALARAEKAERERDNARADAERGWYEAHEFSADAEVRMRGRAALSRAVAALLAEEVERG